MPEWLQSSVAAPEIALPALAARLVIALGVGLFIAGVFAVSQRRPAGEAMPLIVTLVLLTILVAMTTIVIGDSIARAFGLVGALSIVRFRTVVDDTRDTSFVIFAVVVGMAIGAGNLRICLVGVPLVSLAAIGLSFVGGTYSAASSKRLEVRVGAGRDLEPLLANMLREHTRSWKLETVASARQGAAVDLVYLVRLPTDAGMLPLVKAVHALEGVQNVELKDI
jgi:hypothetical protein